MLWVEILKITWIIRLKIKKSTRAINLINDRHCGKMSSCRVSSMLI